MKTNYTEITEANATPANIDAALKFAGKVIWEDTEKVREARKAGVDRMMARIRAGK
jgi:nitrogenase molybdenum-iron protein alpha/beta subunit